MMKSSPKTDLVIDALLMAIWGRRPTIKVLVHSDSGVHIPQETGVDSLRIITWKPA
jgi:transposase InsO family protein